MNFNCAVCPQKDHQVAVAEVPTRGSLKYASAPSPVARLRDRRAAAFALKTDMTDDIGEAELLL
jgi:hypothetical protein